MSTRHPRAPVCHRPAPVVTRWYVAISHHRYAHHAHRRMVRPAFHRIPERRLGARVAHLPIGAYVVKRQKDETGKDGQTYTELRDRGKSSQKSRVPSQSIQEWQDWQHLERPGNTRGSWRAWQSPRGFLRLRTPERLCNMAVYHTAWARCRADVASTSM